MDGVKRRQPVVSIEGAKSHLRATLARALAEALVCGIDNAAAEGRPLTQLQQIDVATMAVMAYHEAIRIGERTIDVDAELTALASTPDPATTIYSPPMTVARFRRLTEDGRMILACNDCQAFWTPGVMRRYGDHACPSCGSTNTGHVTEEVL